MRERVENNINNKIVTLFNNLKFLDEFVVNAFTKTLGDKETTCSKVAPNKEKLGGSCLRWYGHLLHQPTNYL